MFLGHENCQNGPAEGQTLGQNFDFRGHVSTFRAEITTKSWPFTLPKQFLNNSKRTFKKSRNRFLDPENGQNGPLRKPQFDPNFRFQGPYIIFSSRKYNQKLAF